MDSSNRSPDPYNGLVDHYSPPPDTNPFAPLKYPYSSADSHLYLSDFSAWCTRAQIYFNRYNPTLKFTFPRASPYKKSTIHHLEHYILRVDSLPLFPGSEWLGIDGEQTGGVHICFKCGLLETQGETVHRAECTKCLPFEQTVFYFAWTLLSRSDRKDILNMPQVFQADPERAWLLSEARCMEIEAEMEELGRRDEVDRLMFQSEKEGFEEERKGWREKISGMEEELERMKKELYGVRVEGRDRIEKLEGESDGFKKTVQGIQDDIKDLESQLKARKATPPPRSSTHPLSPDLSPSHGFTYSTANIPTAPRADTLHLHRDQIRSQLMTPSRATNPLINRISPYPLSLAQRLGSPLAGGYLPPMSGRAGSHGLEGYSRAAYGGARTASRSVSPPVAPASIRILNTANDGRRDQAESSTTGGGRGSSKTALPSPIKATTDDKTRSRTSTIATRMSSDRAETPRPSSRTPTGPRARSSSRSRRSFRRERESRHKTWRADVDKADRQRRESDRKGRGREPEMKQEAEVETSRGESPLAAAKEKEDAGSVRTTSSGKVDEIIVMDVDDQRPANVPAILQPNISASITPQSPKSPINAEVDLPQTGKENSPGLDDVLPSAETSQTTPHPVSITQGQPDEDINPTPTKKPTSPRPKPAPIPTYMTDRLPWAKRSIGSSGMGNEYEDEGGGASAAKRMRLQ